MDIQGGDMADRPRRAWESDDPNAHDAHHIATGKCVRMLTADGSWDWGAARCQEPSAFYVCSSEDGGGSEDGSVRIAGEAYEPLCVQHNDETKARPGWAWSRPLAPRGGA